MQIGTSEQGKAMKRSTSLTGGQMSQTQEAELRFVGITLNDLG